MPSDNLSMSPTITSMIRLDHMHALAAFHRYHPDSLGWRKRAIVSSTCAALEIHAQLEEEIFYPAIARVLPDDDTLRKSQPEHDKMRKMIRKLREMNPDDSAYDNSFFQLMREVIHHVADEEAVLLPAAERALKSELRTLGAGMTRRRMRLLAQRPGEIAINTAGTFPLATLGMGALLILMGSRCLRSSARSVR
ncbi:hemerythrin domain-containing protein [Paraburkholderia sp. BL17N1]|uniref:hemerythrin domain-containing protein n=1 Tax=Paraburkholderia sp. BL17N1 TaxID=1938798 RepID=UPI000EAE76F9|nr:hemerythrin domain-containing protein [Paraburkholderia sp. BL17N1]RKR31551.1 hemerythrin HHE cation binding domain-containing protein [Paraburkholderia sp. BL17N1]